MAPSNKTTSKAVLDTSQASDFIAKDQYQDSWDSEMKAVKELEDVFQQTFGYKTTQKILKQDSEQHPQVQINFYPAEFVRDYDDLDTLFIVYYAGHGKLGDGRSGLNLTGATTFQSDEDKEIHEIIWNSAENNIRHTRSDVLVIFDCCNAGEMARNVRGSDFTRRADDQFEAWKKDSAPQNWLIEGGPIGSLRKIVLAPLGEPSAIGATERRNRDKMNETKDTLKVRFIFNKQINQKRIKHLSKELSIFFNQGDYGVSTALWEGITPSPEKRLRDVVNYWQSHAMRRSTAPMSSLYHHIISPISPMEPPGLSMSSCEGSVSGMTATDDRERPSFAPEIGPDVGAISSRDKDTHAPKKRKRVDETLFEPDSMNPTSGLLFEPREKRLKRHQSSNRRTHTN
ncbi:hypothetical protein SBOR_6841 [Sclerotinia borealis F-4128]|uniref:Peptidase C14 caspase domain-containing protein n=1 Tax=Sclerotinia borealis (strain F-4128) TaxID=1432307 RepID=W9CD87_SCLBF|nr:hypothetical protein SBOR_6841 [Sclerotinia borealis F-4128]